MNSSPSAFHALAQYVGLSEIGLGVALCGVMCLVIVVAGWICVRLTSGLPPKEGSR